MSGPATAPSQATASANEAAIGDVLDGLKTFRHNYWAPMLLGFVMLFDSWDSIAMALVIPSISAEWSLDPLQMGVLISASYAGQFIGAVSLGAFAERFGRLPVLITAVVLMSLLAAACGLAWNFTSLFWIRLTQGIMIGGALPVAITYVNELAPTQKRGRYFGLFQTLAMSGFSVATLLSPLIVPHLGWRWMLGLGALPLLLTPLIWMTLPESPRWLARIGRLKEANAALVRLGGTPAQFAEHDATPGAPKAEGGKRWAAVLQLFSPELRGRTITVTLLWFLTMFVSFGLTTWVPSIYVQVYDIPLQMALYYTALSSVIMLVVLAISGVVIDMVGRRPFALFGMLVSAATMLGMAFFGPTQVMLVVIAVVIGKVAIFCGTYVLWPYTAESYPTHVRAVTLGYCSSIGRAASMITPIFVGFVLDRGAAIEVVYAWFGVSALIALGLWFTRTRETRGRRLEAV